MHTRSRDCLEALKINCAENDNDTNNFSLITTYQAETHLQSDIQIWIRNVKLNVEEIIGLSTV